MLISVLVLAYNQVEYIEQTINSVTGQTFKDFEIIVMDDCSVDDTPLKIKQLASRDSRIKPFFNACNLGIAGNFNAGLEHCEGDYIALLGGDDWFELDKLQKQVDFLRTEPLAKFIATDGRIFSQKDGRYLNLFSQNVGYHPKRRTLAKEFIKPACTMLPSSYLIESSILKASKADRRFKVFFDFIMDVEIVNSVGGIWFIDEPLVSYRIHDKNIGTSNRALLVEENLMAIGLLLARYPEFSPQLKARMRHALVISAFKEIKEPWPRVFTLGRRVLAFSWHPSALFSMAGLILMKAIGVDAQKIRRIGKRVGWLFGG